MGDGIVLSEYTCHKVVSAAQIAALVPIEGGMRIVGKCGNSVSVYLNWITKHEPAVGGYYVIYEDGYTSFSPAEAFEKGYTINA